jgi:hypothetical protein
MESILKREEKMGAVWDGRSMGCCGMTIMPSSSDTQTHHVLTQRKIVL